MPFGAAVLEDGNTRFSLWAPTAETVDLVLKNATIPMHREEDGVFSIITEARDGALYRYRIDGGQEVPDPASRYQPEDVYDASEVVDPTAFAWEDEHWRDGLRLDAVHAINDASEWHFLDELAERVQEGPGSHRQVHLILENAANEAAYLRGLYDAQWNDDFHHALHVVLTGESAGYYADFAYASIALLGKALAEGYVHGEDPGLPPGAFVTFIQNHDQVGNRAFGERIGSLAPPRAARAAAELYLLAPQTPMLFMGEEWNTDSPFQFFCDFGQDLAPLVARGRREEFASFFDVEEDSIPDPGSEETFLNSMLDWASLDRPEHADHLGLYRRLLALRRQEIMPRLAGTPGGEATYRTIGDRGLEVRWTLGDGSLLTLLADLGPEPLGDVEQPPGRRLYASEGVQGRDLPGWSVSWYLAG